MYKVVASPAFKASLKRFTYFLENKHSKKLAADTVKTIRQKIEQNLAQNPEIAPVSERLVELGINRYRQYRIDEHSLVFYILDEKEKTVLLLAVMDSRQSVEKLLFEVMVSL